MPKKAGDVESRPGLDRTMLVRAALELLKEVGLDGLTTRRLATRLGVKSAALYWHFRNKQELLNTMADALIQDAGMGPPQPGETWQAWLARRARAYRTSLLAYPDSARIVTDAQMLSPATLHAFNEEIRAMVALSFDPTQALRTITAITNYVNGFILQEQGARRPGPATLVPPAAVAQHLSGGMGAPLMLAFAQGGSPYSEESFEYGLTALIEGCAAALGRRGLA